jgi:isoquinoline 1-oxidoreductase beta subunit
MLRWSGALVLSAAWFRSPARAAPGDGEPARPGVGSASGPARESPITAWVRISADGSVTLIASQSEMGQGITTTLAAALADELYLPWGTVSIEFAPYDPAYRDPVYNWMFTGNSQGSSSFYELMRKMGAAAREMLVSAAATRLGVSAQELVLGEGNIRHTGSGRTVRFGEIAGEAGRLPVPKNAQPRPDPSLAGRALPRWDIPPKVDGSAVFGIDVKRPGMLVAAVRCAPRFGAALARYDAQRIRGQPGVVTVVEVPRGLAVVAHTYWEARQALSAANLTWSESGSSLSSGEGLPALYHESLKSGSFQTHKSIGDPGAALTGTARVRTAVYELPFQAHATMEPMNCTAHVTADRCEIWAPTQGVELAQNVAMQVTGLASGKITVHRTLLGGGFGRRLLGDFVKQTLIVAKAVNAPVKLIWSREEDMTHDAYRPGMLHEVSGALDPSGKLLALRHRVVSPSHMLYVWPRGSFPDLRDWTEPVPPPAQYDTMAVEGLLEIPYEVPNQLISQHALALDIPVSVWRTTGHGPNNFVLESFLDELAADAGTDPVAFRRAALGKNARALKVLETLADKADWSRRAPPDTGRGVALAAAFGGLVACAVELRVSGSEIRIHRVVEVVDCGRTLDPGIAASNIAGGIVWGLSGLRTAMRFDNGRAAYSNFDGFEPLHLWETPPSEVHFVQSDAPLGGTGELGPVPVHAAVGNALCALTGKRLRALPLSRSGYSLHADRA